MATVARIEVRQIDGKDRNVFITETVMDEAAKLSSTRKSFIVAGCQDETDVKVNGFPVHVSLNATIPNDKYEPTAAEVEAIIRAKLEKKLAKMKAKAKAKA